MTEEELLRARSFQAENTCSQQLAMYAPKNIHPPPSLPADSEVPAQGSRPVQDMMSAQTGSLFLPSRAPLYPLGKICSHGSGLSLDTNPFPQTNGSLCSERETVVFNIFLVLNETGDSLLTLS